MKRKEYIALSLPKEVMDVVDRTIKQHPDFKNRPSFIRYCIRRYYDELTSLEVQKKR